MKTLSLAPPIQCPQCDGLVFPYLDGTTWKAECVLCNWAGYEYGVKNVNGISKINLTMSASKRFQELCQDIERQGKSGQLLEILEQNFADFLAYVESEEMKRCDALAIGVNTLATLAVLKHI